MSAPLSPVACGTVVTCCDGRPIDLMDPRAEDISFEVIAHHLSGINRYNGAARYSATGQPLYSVAEHCVRAALATIAESGDKRLAAYVLLHDAHEAYLGDDVTPKKRAYAAIVASFGVLAEAATQAFIEHTDRFDRVIHAAAGLAWPPAAATSRQVGHIDRVMLVTEWRDLMPCPPPFAVDVAALPQPIVPWRRDVARASFLAACEMLLPVFNAEAAP
ncbi:MAG: hypothetical protein EPO23_03390 [Xanthobacteraceae bacterium]|nr:MAG: hypothetical protein EPO23_03390 [Xanthobacteraceae bacterium]